MANEPTPEQIEQIAAAVAAGNKIEAIKLYRSFTGSDLKNSKEFIEKLTVELRQKDPTRFPPQPAQKGCMGMVVVFVLLLVLGLSAHAGERSSRLLVVSKFN